MSNIVTFLSFNDRAEEAANFYVSIFKDSRIRSTSPWPDVPQAPKAKLMVVEIELQGQHYILLNGGSHFKFSDGMSLSVLCDSQDEIDHYWAALTSGGGEPGPCGWLRDKFGVSWQVAPRDIARLWGSDAAQGKRVFEALSKMSKIDAAALERASKGV